VPPHEQLGASDERGERSCAGLHGALSATLQRSAWRTDCFRDCHKSTRAQGKRSHQLHHDQQQRQHQQRVVSVDCYFPLAYITSVCLSSTACEL
jgi:hypothetical protein